MPSRAVLCRAVLCSSELDLVLSGAADGSVLLHSLGSGAYVRSLALPLGVPPTLLCLVPSIGEQLLAGGRLFAANGDLCFTECWQTKCQLSGPRAAVPSCASSVKPMCIRLPTSQAPCLYTLTLTCSCTCTPSTAATWPRQVGGLPGWPKAAAAASRPARLAVLRMHTSCSPLLNLAGS